MQYALQAGGQGFKSIIAHHLFGVAVTVHRKHIGLIVFSAILLVLTVACGGDERATPTATPIPPTETPTAVAETNKANQPIDNEGISFRLLSWGFAPEWGQSLPMDGAKYLWVNTESENIGPVPTDMPGKGILTYRGIKASSYTSCIGDSCDIVRSSKYAYPGIVVKGHHVYSVPLDLVGGEAVFSIEIGDKTYEFLLDDPAPTEEKHIKILSVSLDCRSVTYSGGTRQFECNAMHLLLKNDTLHTPISQYDWIVELTLEGREVLGKGQYYTEGYRLKLAPNQQKAFPIIVGWKFDKDRGEYFTGTGTYLDYARMIGAPGTYDAVFTIRGEDGEILGTLSIQLTLPAPEPTVATPNPNLIPAATPAPTPIQSQTTDVSPIDRITLSQLVISSLSDNTPSYNRNDWSHWVDSDGDCQNTRHEVLIEESISPVTFTSAEQCTVLTGLWIARYTGVSIMAASELDVDHMVPLANAHRSGGWAWSDAKKKEFANDLSYPGHLIAATASANRSKGSRGPEEWQPEDKSYWCQYAIDWITIKSRWGLTANDEEWQKLTEMLVSCREVITIKSEDATGTSSPVVASPVPTLTPTPTPTFDTNRGYDVRYDPFGPDRNCGDFANWEEAQAFYIAAGGPASDRHRLDGNSDGIACQSLPGAP